MTTTTTTIQARRPGAAAWLRMIQAEAKMITRDTSGMIVPLGLPVLLLVMQGMMFDDLHQEVGPGVTVLDVYALPVVITLVLAMVAMMNFPSFLATYRKTHILRRLAVTPASPVMVLVAQIVVSFIQVLLGMAIAFGIALIFFDANLPTDVPMAVMVLLASSVAMYALGIMVASVAPTPNAAIAIGIVVFFGTAALGGMFGPVENLPDTLAEIGAWLPFGAAVEAFQSTWLGETVAWQNWTSLAATTLIGTGVAAALFRWE
ncbi:ABC transporter permease [Nesterenkonia muleiensis]|uniref:ABC transporter permease n=1 Tax=Nesterenkonia muleiensis TaxID=2282648 RepID=UPI000E72D771|nr:ABC transporter permease [Nesterenkonia muleiensis]